MAYRILLDWSGWTGAATNGGKINVWLKRNAFVSEYPENVIKRHEIYDASVKSVDGYELLGTLDVTQQPKEATLNLGSPLEGHSATILLTAYISTDEIDLSETTFPVGVATDMRIKNVASEVIGIDTGFKPNITLLG